MTQIFSDVDGRHAILALGGAYTSIGVIWPFIQVAGDTAFTESLTISILVGGAGIVLLYGGHRLPQTEIHPEFFRSIAIWCFRGIGVMIGILIFIELIDSLNDPAANFLILPALAALAGFGAGIHDARAKTREYTLEQRNQELQQTQTELEETVDRLEESEQRYRTVTENFPNGAVALLDDELRHILIAGKGFEKIGISASNFRGERVQDIYSDEVLEVIESNYRATLNGEPTTFELEFQGRIFEFRTHPLSDDDGEVDSIIAISQDITERKQYQEDLEQLVADLEESNERLEQFAYAASHDLQEPLRMVSSYLQLIESRYGDELNEEAEEFLEFAVDGSERMRRMIDGLLQYSRIETRGDEFEPVDLDTVLDDVRKNLQMKIEETDTEITAESLPRVKGDEGQLQQVFQNLLSNAIQFSGEEQPQVHVSAEQNGADWIVSVTDNGIGIDPEDHDRIFKVFEGLHGGEDYVGTGIGLAVCERIIERHDGEIWVDSEPGEGATFSFTLPAV
ncbi:sensor histidine kinase [Natrinema salinisoli]|uniref:sensor histidine kinase n=1 Tax=Natrinema salinisoli TaxID=2878535 RepID=UPI001CF02CA8|nr:ATP-binding protein [Natrinema salinisoli]